MTSSWTAHPLLASPRPACSAAERHPSDSGHGRWISCSVRAGSVPQRSRTGVGGHQRFRQTAGPRHSAHTAEIMRAGDADCAPEGCRPWPDVLAPAAGRSGADPCQPQYQSKNHDGGKHERGPITGLRHPSGDEVHHHDRRRQAGQRHRHPSNRPSQQARQKPRDQQQYGQQRLRHGRTLARHPHKHQEFLSSKAMVRVMRSMPSLMRRAGRPAVPAGHRRCARAPSTAHACAIQRDRVIGGDGGRARTSSAS